MLLTTCYANKSLRWTCKISVYYRCLDQHLKTERIRMLTISNIICSVWLNIKNMLVLVASWYALIKRIGCILVLYALIKWLLSGLRGAFYGFVVPFQSFVVPFRALWYHFGFVVPLWASWYLLKALWHLLWLSGTFPGLHGCMHTCISMHKHAHTCMHASIHAWSRTTSFSLKEMKHSSRKLFANSQSVAVDLHSKQSIMQIAVRHMQLQQGILAMLKVTQCQLQQEVGWWTMKPTSKSLLSAPSFVFHCEVCSFLNRARLCSLLLPTLLGAMSWPILGDGCESQHGHAWMMLTLSLNSGMQWQLLLQWRCISGNPSQYSSW